MSLAYPATALSLKNILLATDLSPASESALKFAQAIARRHGAQLHAINVDGDYYQLLEPEPLNITFQELPSASVQPTEALRRLFRGLPTQLPLREGQIWEVINEVIRRREIDLVVVGTHAREGLDRWLHGSVAEDVLRNATCPVLTVGPDVTLRSSDLPITNVLLATDFDPHSDAPRYAAWLANDFHARLTVLHVAQELTDTDGVDGLPPGVGVGLVRKLIEETELWCKPDSILEYGQPAAKILEVARKTHPDLIVLGARHPEPARINSHLPRPTVAKVVAHAGCPVLTVRQQD